MLKDEIIKKKRFLYVVQNPNNQLFCNQFDSFGTPQLCTREAVELSQKIRNTMGLTDQTPVTFNNVPKLESPMPGSLCPDCNRTCRSPFCFGKHKEPAERSHQQLPAVLKKCQMLYYIAINGKPHKCPSRKCKICKAELSRDSTDEIEVHRCYRRKQNTITVFYDFKTFVDKWGLRPLFLVCTKTSVGTRWCAQGVDCATKFLLHFRTPLYKNAVFIAQCQRF